MSDLQDLIARNATMAYHEGLERGAMQEQERIVQIAKKLAHSDNDKPCCDFDEALFWLMAEIKEEQTN